jgi:hypothetical protein
MLGCLLGALLHISPDIGRLIYLAPRAALGRIAIIEHVLDVTLKDGSETRAAIEKNLRKAKAILGKRHDFIHGRWPLRSKRASRGFLAQRSVRTRKACSPGSFVGIDWADR